MPLIACYAPLKPPYHPVPSGDRAIARLLLRALQRGGFRTELASGLRSYDGQGDARRQARLQQLGARHAERLIARYRRRPADQRPRLWLTYHLYHKAPDWLGPPVSAALGIPYLVAEASYAAKQATGPWRAGLDASAAALRQAALALCLNPRDRDGLARVAPGLVLANLPPFIDPAPFLAPAPPKAVLAQAYGLDPQRPWLISVAMMRPGAKLHSYRLLAAAMRALHGIEPGVGYELLLVGDGAARGAVAQAFAGLPRCHLLGALPPGQLIPLLQASELLLWPAVDEAFGMALLEAQACATAVLAGDEGGVAGVVHDGVSGHLLPPRDPRAMATCVAALLRDPEALAQLQRGARAKVLAEHSLDGAARRLRRLLLPLIDASD